LTDTDDEIIDVHNIRHPHSPDADGIITTVT